MIVSVYRPAAVISRHVPSSAVNNLHQSHPSERGQVCIVGAGPGDPELLTLKAYRMLQTADVVLYDWLVSDEIMTMIPAKVQRLFVGKKAGQHSKSQTQIVQLLIEQASQGKRVVRLKGGDPAIFGRLTEETQALAAANIPFAIVPGISAASGCSAATGIPLTDRHLAQSVRLVTAHLQDADSQPDWNELVNCPGQLPQETLVFYMGLAKLDQVCYGLMEHGMPQNTAVAVVDQATTANQKICIGQLQDIADKVAVSGFCGPSLIIVGQVVTLRTEMRVEVLQNITTQGWHLAR